MKYYQLAHDCAMGLYMGRKVLLIKGELLTEAEFTRLSNPNRKVRISDRDVTPFECSKFQAVKINGRRLPTE